MSLRAGEGLDSGTITGGTGSTNHSVTDHHADDLRTPGKNDNKSSKSGSSNSSNSSGSGGDNHYSADCSGDGGSDDNQSSDDTSGKPKQHAMMLDSSAMLAHHHHHHQQQHQHQNHKGGGKNNQYVNDNTSSDSNSSNEDDDENDHQPRDKDKSTGRSAYNKNFGGYNHRGNPDGVEHTQQQLSLLTTNTDPTTTVADANNHGRDGSKSAMTTTMMMMMIDPQINLSLVHHVPSSSLVLPLHATATAALLQSVVPLHQQQQQLPTLDSRSTALDHTPPPIDTTVANNHHGPMIMSHHTGPQPHPMVSPAVAPPSDLTEGIPPPAASLLTVEHYRHLMEAVRPFFTVQGMMYPHYVPYPTVPTTTFDDSKVKGENVPVADNGNSTNPSSSEGFTSFFTTTTDESGGDMKATTKVALAEEERINGRTPEDGITDDNASMAVLARAKRKYAKSMQRHPNLQQQQLQTMESSSQTTSSSSDATSLNDRDQNLRNYAPVDENNHHHHHNSNDSARTMSRMVTDVSSSNPTTTSGSGSGDNGMNTTTGGSGSGTGSNQGSSGSGNDGKGSSEELAKEDSNSGGDGMNGSDGSSNKINNHRGTQVVSSVLDDSNAADRQPQQNQQKSLSTDVRGDGIHVASTPTETATREQKMLVKKRKRIVMRREYEAQQRQMSSSDSSGDSTEHFFPPGRPLTLDQVLVFSKIPRLVIQGTPPFLIVHMNAACCRLTGIDAHLLVGKPISVFLSIPSFSVEDCDIVENVGNETSLSTIKPGVDAISGIDSAAAINQSSTTSLEMGESHMTVDRLIMTCGCDGVAHLVNVQTKLASPSLDCEENKILCRLSIAPIVVSKDVVGGGTLDNHDQSKRARYQHSQVGSQEVPQLQHQELKFPLITHFVIQFEVYDSDHYGDSMESLSSANSVDEEQLVGTKANKHMDLDAPSRASAQPNEVKTSPSGNNNVESSNIDPSNLPVEGSDVDGSISAQSSDREPIVAIG